MKEYPQYDVLEFERLYRRLVLQKENAFFCVTVNPALSHGEIVARLNSRFPVGAVQVIDFKEVGSHFRFSSDFLYSSLRENVKIVFLANFQLACGDMSDPKFFQILNLSRDVLAGLPVVFVFLMPQYFRKKIALNAPDFNSFFAYHSTFETKRDNYSDSKSDPLDSYNETDFELLKYYEEKYNTLVNNENRQALAIIIKILKLNSSVRTLSYVELNHFYGTFRRLLPIYQSEFIPAQTDLNATTYNDIAGVFESQGDYKEALLWYQMAMAIREKGLGKEHPDTAAIYNNIAGVYCSQGDYPKALEWRQKALTIDEKVLGKEHPSTATTYNNIAFIYSRQGDYQKALEWYQKALTIEEKVLGKEHPSTAISYNNIAFIYSRQGDYQKALEWFQKALAINVKVQGKEHPSTAISYNNSAFVYDSQGNYSKALEWYQKALAIYEKVLGKEHPDTATTYNNIAGIYYHQSDYQKALEWYQKALAIREEVLGKEHPDTATTYNNIAGVYERQGDYQKALEWYQKALEIDEKVLGKEHPDTATTYNNIALVYSRQGDYQKASE